MVSRRSITSPHCSSGIRCIVVVLIALFASVAVATSVQAGKGWCRVDPVFIIDGHMVDVFVGSDLSAFTSTTGPIKLTVTVPANTNVTHVISDAGFGKGYEISVVTSRKLKKTADRIQVQVKVYVPAKSNSLPVTVYFSPRVLSILTPVTADGYANQWVIVNSGIS